MCYFVRYASVNKKLKNLIFCIICFVAFFGFATRIILFSNIENNINAGRDINFRNRTTSTIVDDDYISFLAFSQAIAVFELNTIKKYKISNHSTSANNVYRMAFEEKFDNHQYVVQLFVRRANNDRQAEEWFKTIVNDGFDVNSKIVLGKVSTSLFWISIEEGAIDFALFLIKNGLSPHSWHDLKIDNKRTPRMAWPVEYILYNKSIPIVQKKAIIELLIKANAFVSDTDVVRRGFSNLAIPLNIKSNICDSICLYQIGTCKLIKKYLVYYVWRSSSGSAWYYPDAYFLDSDNNIYIRTLSFNKENYDYYNLNSQAGIVIKIDKDEQVSVYVNDRDDSINRSWREIMIPFTPFDNAEIWIKAGATFCKHEVVGKAK